MQGFVIHILLATYQGAPHLSQQLASIAAQTHGGWLLWASDDGSTDGTVGLLQAFAHAHPTRVQLLQGPRQGAARNFFSLIHGIGGVGINDLVAFCDQDDVWLPDKLARAAQWHAARAAPEQPGLYMARTTITNSALNPLGHSRVPHTLGIGNALVENVAGGNSMVFNQALLHTLRRIQSAHMVLHDWSAYLAAAACGAQMVYDEKPCLLYRQHAANVIGAAPSWRRRVLRLWKVSQGGYRVWGTATEGAMIDLQPQLTVEATQALAAFQGARHGRGPVLRLRQARRAGLTRQSLVAQAGLLAMVALGLL